MFKKLIHAKQGDSPTHKDQYLIDKSAQKNFLSSNENINFGFPRLRSSRFDDSETYECDMTYPELEMAKRNMMLSRSSWEKDMEKENRESLDFQTWVQGQMQDVKPPSSTNFKRSLSVIKEELAESGMSKITKERAITSRERIPSPEYNIYSNLGKNQIQHKMIDSEESYHNLLKEGSQYNSNHYPHYNVNFLKKGEIHESKCINKDIGKITEDKIMLSHNTIKGNSSNEIHYSPRQAVNIDYKLTSCEELLNKFEGTSKNKLQGERRDEGNIYSGNKETLIKINRPPLKNTQNHYNETVMNNAKTESILEKQNNEPLLNINQPKGQFSHNKNDNFNLIDRKIEAHSVSKNNTNDSRTNRVIEHCEEKECNRSRLSQTPKKQSNAFTNRLTPKSRVKELSWSDLSAPRPRKQPNKTATPKESRTRSSENSSKILANKILEEIYNSCLELKLIGSEDIEYGDNGLDLPQMVDLLQTLGYLPPTLSNHLQDTILSFWAVLHGEEQGEVKIRSFTILVLALYGILLDNGGLDTNDMKTIHENFSIMKDFKRSQPRKSHFEAVSRNFVSSNPHTNSMALNHRQKIIEKGREIYEEGDSLIDIENKLKANKLKELQRLRKEEEFRECTFKPLTRSNPGTHSRTKSGLSMNENLSTTMNRSTMLKLDIKIEKNKIEKLLVNLDNPEEVELKISQLVQKHNLNSKKSEKLRFLITSQMSGNS